jgi:hypothetical protein
MTVGMGKSAIQTLIHVMMSSAEIMAIVMMALAFVITVGVGQSAIYELTTDPRIQDTKQTTSAMIAKILVTTKLVTTKLVALK